MTIIHTTFARVFTNDSIDHDDFFPETKVNDDKGVRWQREPLSEPSIPASKPVRCACGRCWHQSRSQYTNGQSQKSLLISAELSISKFGTKSLPQPGIAIASLSDLQHLSCVVAHMRGTLLECLLCSWLSKRNQAEVIARGACKSMIGTISPTLVSADTLLSCLVLTSGMNLPCKRPNSDRQARNEERPLSQNWAEATSDQRMI